MRFRVLPTVFIDKSLDEGHEKKYRIDVAVETSDHTKPYAPFLSVWGWDKEVCSMRAGLICNALNRGEGALTCTPHYDTIDE